MLLPPLFPIHARRWNAALGQLLGNRPRVGDRRTEHDGPLAVAVLEVRVDRVCGERAVRVDILERLADLIRPALAWREGAPGQKPPGAFDGRGFTVTGAVNGQDALEKCELSPPDLILSDTKMPEMDGLEATQIIRAREQTEETPYSKLIARRADRGTGGAAGRRIPIVAMTSSLPGDGSAQCLAAGMDEFVTKPVSIKVLAEVATRWIAGGGKALAA